jgi:hypothetical protein
VMRDARARKLVVMVGWEGAAHDRAGSLEVWIANWLAMVGCST